ncbi:MAG TPA: DUF6602 domain-containing protein [Blastocatellia bacterium]|nr:DUF6602 domain-containing protein [Blastocatellia bacterium]
MITTVAKLIAEFQQKETEILNRMKISHPPTIGAMFEGLTREMLDYSIPEGLNLNIRSGFIRGKEGELSRQIDCMLVRGEGEQIRHTDNYIYSIDDVIAVVEVKKNLYTNDLASAYENLRSVAEMKSNGAFNERLFRSTYRAITNANPPNSEEFKTLAPTKQLFCYSVQAETIMPVRIVLGYQGFSTEYSLREAFLGFLKAYNDSGGKSSPEYLPSLIICGTHSLIKLNGMPYLMRTDPDWWPVYASFTGNHTVLLLEQIWSRLVHYYGLPQAVFGEDLEMESLRLLLLAKIIQIDERVGWMYDDYHLTAEELGQMQLYEDWKPAPLSTVGSSILLRLAKQGDISINDQELLAFVQSEGRTIDDVVQELYFSGQVAIEDGVLSLTDSVVLSFTPDGDIVVSHINDHRTGNWLIRKTSNGRDEG